MSNIRLSFAAGSVARLGPIMDGSVRPEGIDLTCSEVPPSWLFWQVPHSDPFDVAELSLTGYLWGIQQGKPWAALPVFPGWVFGCHTETLCRVDADIQKPEDLKGKRVGVPEYPVTAIMWIRHALETEHGVRPQDILWFEERTEQYSHYRLMGYRPPPDVHVEIIDEDKRLCDMLISGEIDAVTRYFGRPPAPGPLSLVDRSNLSMSQLAEHPEVRWLYPDRKVAAMAYTRKLGHLQPIHCIIVSWAVAREHPWVAKSLVDAFAESARRTADADYVRPVSYRLTKEEQVQVIGRDFFPVGLERHRRALEHFLQLAHRDGFVVGSRQYTLEDLFPLGVDA